MWATEMGSTIMRFLRVPSAALMALLLPGPLVAQGWFEYVNQDDRFTVNLPAEPDVRDVDYESEFNAIFPARLYSAEVGGDRYSVTVVDFTDAQRIHEEMEKTEAATAPNQWINDQLASIARAARQFRERDGEVLYDAWSHIDMVQGHQLQMLNPDQTRTFAGIYMNGHSSRLFVLEATVGSRSPPPAQFQQSLRFLNEEDEPVRYDLSPTGCSIDRG